MYQGFKKAMMKTHFEIYVYLITEEMKQKNRNGKNLRGSLICLLILILGKEMLLCKKSVTENTRNVCT